MLERHYPGSIMPVHVGIFLIASAVIVLAWLKKNDDEMDRLPALATCHFGTLEIFFSRVNSLVGDDNARE